MRACFTLLLFDPRLGGTRSKQFRWYLEWPLNVPTCELVTQRVPIVRRQNVHGSCVVDKQIVTDSTEH